MIYAVVYNDYGRLTRSQEFRITAQTDNFVAAMATENAFDHRSHREIKEGWWNIGERVVIDFNNIYEEDGVWMF